MYKVQSVLFDKKKFNVNQAIDWLVNHNYKLMKIHETNKEIRFRQIPPNQLKKEGYLKFRNYSLNNGVILVLAYKI